MAYTQAQREKFFELVKKYENATRYNEEAQDLSNRIAEMAKTNEGLAELAQLITEDLEEEMKAYDLRPLFFGPVKKRALNETVEYRKKGKFRAYQITHGGYVPKSRIFEDTVTVQPDIFAVRPACDLLQLEVGKIASVQELRDGAKEAMLDLYNKHMFGLLDAAIPEDNQVEVAGGVIEKGALDAAIRKAAKHGKVSIVGSYAAVTPIADFDGFTDQTKYEIEKTGKLGVYRGANIVILDEYLDADEEQVIKDDVIFIVVEKAGHIDDFGELRNREIIDAEHDELSIKIQTMWGVTVTDAHKMWKIKINA